MVGYGCKAMLLAGGSIMQVLFHSFFRAEPECFDNYYI